MARSRRRPAPGQKPDERPLDGAALPGLRGVPRLTARMRKALRAIPLAALVLMSSGAAQPARADGIRILSADDRGVTLELVTPPLSLTAPAPDGRVRVAGLSASAHTLGEPGHPALPAFTALLALPPEARPSARVLSSTGEEVRSGVAMAINGRPVFLDDPAGLGTIGGMEAVAAIAEGVWPEQPLVLGVPTSFRGRRLVPVELRPYRFDPSGGRLMRTGSLVVRVDFGLASGARSVGGIGEADRHVDPVLATTVLNWEQARDWRTRPSPSARPRDALLASRLPGEMSILGSDPQVRVRVDTTGLQVLPYGELAAKGYPAGTPVAQVRVFRREPIAAPASGQPPFIGIELPIEVQDMDANGIFGPGDLIWVYVRTWAERSGASLYQRQWGDAEVIYVTRFAGGGARMATRAGWRGISGLTPIASYPQRTRWEGNFAAHMPFVGTPSDTTFDLFHWTEISFYYNRPDTIRFEVQDIDTSRFVQFTTQWVGRRFGSHNTWAAVRNGNGQVTTVADSVRWSNKAPATTTTSVRGSAMTEGRTNFLRQWGKNAFQPPDPTTNASASVGFNWFDTEYWRRTRAVDDVIHFNSAETAGEVQYLVERFRVDSIRVYDVTDPDQPVRILIDPAHRIPVGSTLSVEFQDSVATGQRRSYAAGGVQFPYDPATGPRTPPTSAYSAVVENALWANPAGDYLLVAPDAWLAQLAPLAAKRQAQGLAVVTAPVQSIYDEFNGGRPGPVGIQRFVRWGYDHWDSRFLLLAGDGTLDPNNFRRTSGGDWVPVLPSPGPVPVGEGYEIIPSDNRYACVTGNCDPILGFGAVIPEMMVGRLPVNSPAQAAAVVQKLLAYEDVGSDESWRRRVLLLSDDAYSGETFFGGGTTTSNYCHRDYENRFVALADTMRGIIRGDAGLALMDVEKFDLRFYLPNEPYIYAPPADTCRPSRSDTQTRTHGNVTPQLFSKLSRGVLWFNYQGHANEFVLTHEDLYRNLGDGSSDDKNLLANDGKPFLFSAFSCHANMFARPENQNNPAQGAAIGEDLVTLPSKGAIGSWASVCFEVVPRDNANHVNVAMTRAFFSDPPRDEVLGERGSRVILGEALLATYLRYIPTVQNAAYERGIAVSYALLGDPATRLSIGQPQNIVLANDLPVIDAQAIRLHTPGDTLRLEARLVSTVRLDSLGVYRVGASGVQPVDASDYTVTPSFPDTAAATSQYGGRRFTLVHRTSLAPVDQQFIVVVRDRDGRQSRTTASFTVTTGLRVDGSPISDDDQVSPIANLSLLLLSPAPLVPASDLTLSINGQPQSFSAVANPGDASGREWILSWVHDAYPIDDYLVQLDIAGGPSPIRRFRVSTAAGELKLSNLMAFPNPFDNDGTALSFSLLGSEPADARVSVFTISGRVIQSFMVPALAPGYHQIRWDGRDAEGSDIANGIYFYRLSAVTPSGARVEQLGRLVKLRKPRRVAEDTALAP